VRPSQRTRSSSGGGICSHGAGGGALGKAVGGGAHLSGGVAWRWWRMLQAAAFNGCKVAPVTDDVDGVDLQCWRRRDKVRGEPIWTERERAIILTDDGG
jgi:hypothetical protein